jgi:hypothetical protein
MLVFSVCGTAGTALLLQIAASELAALYCNGNAQDTVFLQCNALETLRTNCFKCTVHER